MTIYDFNPYYLFYIIVKGGLFVRWISLEKWPKKEENVKKAL